MEAINTFSGGMETDVSKVYQKPGTYLQALNFRGLNELGSSNGSLVNIKGNECKITFPNLQAVYKLKVIEGSLTNSNELTFTINGVTYSTPLVLNNNTTGNVIYDYITTNFPACYQYTETIVATKTFAISYQDDYIVFYQQPVYQDCSTVASINTDITISYSEATDGTYPTLQFVNNDNTISLTQNTTIPYIRGITSSKIITIGSTFILNDIYLLTAYDDSTYTQNDEFNDTFTKPGQIWKLQIDDITKQHTLTLLYSNLLDFTKYHPIPPSAISGRYESVEIQRIYWSDNFNKIRTLNVATQQLMAINPTILSVIPKVEYTQGILDSIGAGSLDAGCYQLSYRLSKVLGSVTNYSELSAPVYLTKSDPSGESTPFWQYEGALGATGKSITWKLTGLDTNYDNIEFVVSYRNSSSAVPSITSLGTITLLEDMTIPYVDASTTGYSDVTLEEFLLFSGTFTHAKTCDTKDNRLFWGNVRAPRKELEDYDSRAFRANDAGHIVLVNNGDGGTNYTPTTAAALAQTEDTINEYYQESDGDYSTNACYLKPSTALTTKELGGEGVNVSYVFGTDIIEVDSNAQCQNTEGWDFYQTWVGAPYRFGSSGASNPSGLAYTYPNLGSYDALKQPARTSLLRGFQHEEIYRFGLQLFDREGNPYFTKWIGDIKMPSYGDVNFNPGGSVNDFRLTYLTGSNQLVQQILYIKFTVNLSRIINLVGGYQIVRTKRDGTNKTIWGVGMINPMMPISGDDLNDGTATLTCGWDGKQASFQFPAVTPAPWRYYTPFPSQEACETLNYNDDIGNGNHDNFSAYKSFDCWDFDLGLRPTRTSFDRIRVRSRLVSMNYRNDGMGYREFFSKDNDYSGNQVPGSTSVIGSGSAPDGLNQFHGQTPNDNTHQAYFIMKMVEDTLYDEYGDFVTPSNNTTDYVIDNSTYIAGNDTGLLDGSGITIANNSQDADTGSLGATGNPSQGKQSLFLKITNNLDNSKQRLYTSDYGCVADGGTPFYKLLALYYQPNKLIYGGNTYVARTSNEYIPCGEYIKVVSNNVNVNVNSSFKCFGGDVFSAIYDMQKTFFGVGAEYHTYNYNPSSPWAFIPLSETINRQAKFGTSFFFGVTTMTNCELRTGNHVNRSLSSEGGFGEDDYNYNNYCNAENDIRTYFPKPLNFQSTNEWFNRIYFSEIKFNNEINDSWSEYLTGSFYDVEGNYGGINALVSLKENMYYLQERGVGSLMINPVSLINDSLGQSVKLGGSTPNSPVIQKHYYKAIDAGTFHQWSVYRSQSAITFVDARHKKIYLFNGESVTPISDTKGQRSFVIKRLHNELLKYDNPVINKGIITTYDYYHNEFLYTFNNIKQLTTDPITYDITNNENLTLAYSEVLDAFTGLYSFTPNLYINSNKYLISTNSTNKLWFHNYGAYGSFYGTIYPSTLKLLINDNPLYTKVFDNMTIESEAINDKVEWNDDLNVYPGSPTNPLYPDDVNIKDSTFQEVRCYNQYQNTDWTTLTITPPGNNIRKVEQGFNLQLPRNKFDYDTYSPSTYSIFDPSKLTKTTFGERLRDKWLITDFKYNNSAGLRFIIHNIKTLLRISDR